MTGAPSIPRERVPRVDLAWRRMDDPTNLTVINGVLWFDRPLDVERFRRTLEERFLIIPRFRQKLVWRHGRAHWEEDPDFDLDLHLHHDRLGGAGDEEALRERVSTLMSEPLDPDHPLWRFYVFDDFDGGSALLARIHHCIGDGLALMMVLLSLTDLHPDDLAAEEREDNPLTALFHRAREAAGRLRQRAEEETRERIEEAREHLQHARRRVERVLPEAMKLLLKPSEMLRSTSAWLKGLGSVRALGRLTLQIPDARTALKGPLGKDKRVAWSRGIPVDDIDRLRTALGGTLNDVLITAIAGGLRRYLDTEGGVRAGLSVRALVPVSLRPLEEMSDLGNRFGLVLLSLPVGILDPLERLAELRRRFRKLHRSMEPAVAYRILAAMGASPLGVQRLVMRFFTAKATAVMTSVPGPRQRLFLAGRELGGMMFWVPHPGALGLGLSILTYAGEVRLGVAVDAGLVPEPQGIVDGFYEELAEMRRRAGIPAGPRSESPSAEPSGARPGPPTDPTDDGKDGEPPRVAATG